ncbi:hypothetical protein [Streptomyces sp. NPDC057002]|uniref:hypothetical protein n=1 Tax=Streptomyces sp. NPDC057002 TaxID=3345992 RepID=UPI00364245EF
MQGVHRRAQEGRRHGEFATGAAVAENALTAANNAGRKLTIGSGDLSTKVLKDIEAGKIQYAMDQQPYLQTYYGVLIAKQYVRYGIASSGTVLTGPLAVDKDTAGEALKINETYKGIRGERALMTIDQAAPAPAVPDAQSEPLSRSLIARTARRPEFGIAFAILMLVRCAGQVVGAGPGGR